MLAKNQANAKQHSEPELLLENYSHFSSTLSSKNNRTYSKGHTRKPGDPGPQWDPSGTLQKLENRDPSGTLQKLENRNPIIIIIIIFYYHHFIFC